MGRTFLAGIILAAFFLRDLRLLASAGPIRIAWACGFYCVLSGIYSGLLILGFSLTGIQQPDLISFSRNEWACLMAIHLVLWGGTWLLSCTSLRNRAWILALAPSPATLLAQCLLVALLPENMGNSLGLFSIFLFSITWNALMIPFAYELSLGAFWNRFASARSLILVGCLNLFSFLFFLYPVRDWVGLP